MDNTNTLPPVKEKRKREVTDFSTLSNKELDDLSNLWEKEAWTFDVRFQAYLNGAYTNEEKTKSLNAVANKLWRKVGILERWRARNGHKQPHRKN